MKEFSHSEKLNLLPETQELLKSVQALTGMPVDIQPDPGIRGMGRAVYIASETSGNQSHRVLYDPLYEQFLDHHVAHECGHILRLAAVDVNERVALVTTSDHTENAALQLLPDIEELLERGDVSEDYLGKLLPLWLSGTISQLYNTPADIHIERWIHQDYPTLRSTQTASILSSAEQAHLVLNPMIEEVTPRHIWNVSNAMNYALFKSAINLSGNNELIKPYKGTPAEILGEDLFEMIESTADTGFEGDRQLVDLWADKLELQGWFTWQKYQRLAS